jgi:hypothetical protein
MVQGRTPILHCLLIYLIQKKILVLAIMHLLQIQHAAWTVLCSVQ